MRRGTILVAVLTLLLSVFGGVAPQTASAFGTGVISGVVRDESGRPIPDAWIEAYSAGGTAEDDAVGWESTGADGQFTMGGLDDGDYKLVFSAGDFKTEWFEDAASFGEADPLEVSGGVGPAPLVVTLAAYASISGTVTDPAGPMSSVRVEVFDATTGRMVGESGVFQGVYTVGRLEIGTYKIRAGVLDGARNWVGKWLGGVDKATSAEVPVTTDGELITGMDFFLDRLGYITGVVTRSGLAVADTCVQARDASTDRRVATSCTNAQGIYSASGLPAGKYKLFVPDNSSSGGIWFGGTSKLTAEIITVKANQAVSGKSLALAPVASIGGVFTLAGVPEGSGADVSIRAFDATSKAYVASDYLGGSGNYLLVLPGAGSYKVQTEVEVYGDNDSVRRTVWWNGKSSVANADPIAVATGQRIEGRNISVNMSDPVPVGSISGSLNAGGSPPPFTRSITLYSADYADSDFAYVATVSSSGDGSFSFSSVPPGQYRLQVSDGGSTDPWLGRWYGSGGQTYSTASIFSVSANTTTPLGAIALPQGATVKGRVTGGGAGVPGVRMQLSAKDQYGDVDVERQATTDSQGYYTIVGAVPGRTYKLEAYTSNVLSGDWLNQWYLGATSFESGTVVTATSAGQQVTLQDMALQSTGAIQGTVTAPLTDWRAAVVVYDSATDQEVVRDEVGDWSGAYRIRVKPGTYLVRVEPSERSTLLPRYYPTGAVRSEAQPIVVGSTAVTGRDISLTVSTATLSGVVVGEDDGTGVARAATVRAYSSTGEFLRSVDTQWPDGGYSLPLASDDVKIQVEFDIDRSSPYSRYLLGEWHNNKPDSASADPITVSGATVQDISLRTWGELTGVVTAAAQPVPDVRAFVYRASDGQFVTYGRSDETGRYSVRGVPPGQYRVEFDTSVAPGTWATEWSGGAMSMVAAAVWTKASGQDLVNDVELAPATLPGAPTGVAGTPGNASAVVKWVAPASNGGSAITGYTVTASPSGKSCSTTGATTCTVSGLTNGTAYTFTVKATNALGTGAPSAASAAVVPRTVPGAPTSVVGTPGNASAVVKWVAPASNGGSVVSGYTVTSTPGSRTCVTTGALSCTVTGLANGTSHTFKVVARNVAGTGAPSAASVAVVPRTVPGAPTSVVGTPGNASAVVKWVAPASNGGSVVSGYTVTATPGSRTCVTTGALSCTVTGLTNGTSYTFKVVARNVAGTGAASAASVAVVPRIPVTVSVAKAGYGNVLAVNINPDRGTAAYSFRVQKRSSTGVWSTLSSVYSSEGTAETRSITLGAGVFRVVVPAAGAYGTATSAAVTLTAPTVKVSLTTDSAKDRLKVNVNPDKGTGYWTFKVQKRSSSGTWSTLSTVYKTEGTAETKTVNLGAGTYRVVVAAKYNYLGATSVGVTLVK